MPEVLPLLGLGPLREAVDEGCVRLVEAAHEEDGLHELDWKSPDEVLAVGAREELVGETRTAEAGFDEIVDEEVTVLTVDLAWHDIAVGLWVDGGPIKISDESDGRFVDVEVLEARFVGGTVVDGHADFVEASDLCFGDEAEAEAALHKAERGALRRLAVDALNEVPSVPAGAVAIGVDVSQRRLLLDAEKLWLDEHHQALEAWEGS